MKSNTQAGFSYIDVMIAIVILTVGILAMLSALTASVIQAKGQEQQISAKQVATSTMESIMSAKETVDDKRQLGWNSIRNYCASTTTPNCDPQGIFPIGFQSVGANAGVDQIIGTRDDTGSSLNGFQRQIQITDVCDIDRPSPPPVCPDGLGAYPYRVRIRRVSVTIAYFVNSLQRQETLSTVLTDYSTDK